MDLSSLWNLCLCPVADLFNKMIAGTGDVCLFLHIFVFFISTQRVIWGVFALVRMYTARCLVRKLTSGSCLMCLTTKNTDLVIKIHKQY